MTVQIVYPPDNGDLPDPITGWVATATISPNDDGTSDPMDGTLFDIDNGWEAYPSDWTNQVGQDSSGNYIWQISLTHDSDIQPGHQLLLYCYDTVQVDDGSGQYGATNAETAVAPGLVSEKTRGGKPAPPSDAPPKIKILAATLSGTTVTVQVDLTPGTKGMVLLVFRKGNTTGGQSRILPPSSDEKRTCTFSVATDQWTYIYAVALIPGQRGKTKGKPVKAPKGKTKPKAIQTPKQKTKAKAVKAP